MRLLNILVGTVVLAIVLAIFGPAITSMSADVALHHLLVDVIMRHGQVRPEGVDIGVMNFYPPLSHWAAAFLGWIGGSGIAAMWILAIVAIGVGYYAIGRIVVMSGVIATICFVLLFGIFTGSMAQFGWEVVNNFFYPQIVATAVYLCILAWLANQMPGRLLPPMLAGLLSAVLYLIQPLAGIHLTATVALFLCVEAVSIWRQERRVPDVPVLLAVLVGCVGLAMLFLNSSSGQIIENSAHEGSLSFGFPARWMIGVVGICAAISASTLVLGLMSTTSVRAHVDRLMGSAGCAAVALIILQYISFTFLQYGSFYAVKKHIFLVVTFAVINLARLASRSFKSEYPVPYVFQPLIAIGVSGMATAWVLSSANSWEIRPIIEVENYANTVVAVSPEFRPGNTASIIGGVPTMNWMTAMTALRMPYSQAVRDFPEVQKEAEFLIIRVEGDEFSCAIARNYQFAVVPRDCYYDIANGEEIEFGAGGVGVPLLGVNWHAPEGWGVWSKGSSTITLDLSGKPATLKAQAMIFAPPTRPNLDFEVRVNGTALTVWRFSAQEPEAEKTVSIPASEGPVTIEFVPLAPLISPSEAGLGEDDRKLGLGLRGLRIE